MRALAIKIGNPSAIVIGSAGHLASHVVHPARRGEMLTPDRLVNRLEQVHEAYPLDVIRFDEPRARGGKGKLSAKTRHVAALRAAVLAWAQERGIPAEPVSPVLFRKLWRCQGGGAATELEREAERRGFVTECPEEAEALAIFHAVMVEKGYAEDPRNAEVDRAA